MEDGRLKKLQHRVIEVSKGRPDTYQVSILIRFYCRPRINIFSRNIVKKTTTDRIG